MSAHMIHPHEADTLIREHMPTYGANGVPIEEAVGRILRTAIRADRDLPPFDRVTMDGIAIDFAAWQAGQRRFTVLDTAVAGRPAPELTDATAGCIQVMTGTMLPGGTNAVIPYEDLDLDDGVAVVSDTADVVPLQNLHSQASDRRAGEIIVPPGTRLSATHISIAAAVGCSRVQVAYPPAVAIVSTGDELKQVEDAVEPFQIRSANDYGIRATLTRLGYIHVERFHVRDDLAETTELLKRLLTDFDVLILTGGVSMGKRDFVPTALETCRVTNHFHKIRQKPGKPMWFGTSPNGKPVFALPGNTVSTLVCLHRYVCPALAHAQGKNEAQPQWVRIQDAIRWPLPLTGFIPVRLVYSSAGICSAIPCETNTSGDFAALSESDGFVELPEGQNLFPAGSIVQYRVWQ